MYVDLFFSAIPLITWLLISILLKSLDASRFQVRGFVAPYFASIAIIFALFSSLLATEVWQKASAIKSEVTKEVSGLRSLYRLTEALETPKELVADKLDAYVRSIVSKELAISRNDSSKEADSDLLISNILVDLYKFGISAENFGGNSAINMVFLNELSKVRDAHLQRNALEHSSFAVVKLAALLMFGILTQTAVGLSHNGNARASFWSIGLFSLAFSLSVMLITLIDKPFGASHLLLHNYASNLWLSSK